MQSAAFTLSSSPSLPLLKPPSQRSLVNTSFTARFDPILASSRRQDLETSSNIVFPRRSWSLALSPSQLRPWNPLPPLVSETKTDLFQVKATAVPESAGDGEKSSSLVKTLELGLLFGLWYLFNIYFNIYNKQVRLFCSLYFFGRWLGGGDVDILMLLSSTLYFHVASCSVVI